MVVLTLLAVNVLIFVLALMWIMIPVMYGLPSRPTRSERVRKALQLADLKKDELLYDLGAGDGRVLLMAAKEFGAKAVGVEIGPIQCALIWMRITAAGFSDRISIQWGNFYKTELNAADVVYMYATSTEILKLAPRLQAQMKKGSRLISISADFPAWEPNAIDERNLIFVYEMPPKEGSLTTYMLKNAER